MSPSWISALREETVSLGAANFQSSTDHVSADWYWPMPSGVTYLYSGYGAFAGATRIETYTPGQLIAGVKTVKWHMETKNAGSSMATVEDWWLALDVGGNLNSRVVPEFHAEPWRLLFLCLWS